MNCKSENDSNFIAKLEVNGQKIDLNSFVENFLSEAVIGMLKSLRGVDAIETIDLKISRNTRNSKQ